MKSKISSANNLPLLQPLKSVWQQEWTAIWGWLCTSFGVVGLILTNTDVKAALPLLNLPPYITVGLAVFGAITLVSMEHKDNV
jgi:hypothetical protein